MNFQLDKTAPRLSVITLQRGTVSKPLSLGASYFNMENNEEIWKDVVGYEGHYQVSNLGRVKSIDRIVVCSRGFNHNKKGRIMTPTKHSVDPRYKQINISKNGKIKVFLMHRLVAISFIPNTHNKGFVNHIDGNPNNNCVENLEWCTPSENLQHSYDKLGRNGRRTVVVKISKDGFVLNVYRSYTEAANDNNVNTSEITRCCAFHKGRRSPKHKPFVKGYIYM